MKVLPSTLKDVTMLLSVSFNIYVTTNDWESTKPYHTVLTCRVNSYLMFTDVMLRIMSPEHMYLYLDTMNVMQKMIDKGYHCKHCTVWM